MVAVEESNRKLVEELVEGINAGDVSVMDEVFHKDAVMEWPQSKERVRGGDNRRAVYGNFGRLPKVTLRRIVTAGDLAVALAVLDYDGSVYETTLIFEFRDGRIARETAYWGAPFEAPEWRSRWVERME